MTRPVAIITGAGGAIGRAVAIELNRLQHYCVLVGRTEATLRQSQQNLTDALIVRADVTTPAEVEAVVEQTLSRFGRIDVLVNNAGMAPVLSIAQMTPQEWREVIDTNLSAVFYLCRAVWPMFAGQRSGIIVNISSMAARDPFPGFLAYGAAKAGLNNLGLSLSREGSAIGVRVHTIAPGAVETPMLRGILSTDQLSSDNTLDPADVARVVGECVAGDLCHTSGEVVWLSRSCSGPRN